MCIYIYIYLHIICVVWFSEPSTDWLERIFYFRPWSPWSPHIGLYYTLYLGALWDVSHHPSLGNQSMDTTALGGSKARDLN